MLLRVTGSPRRRESPLVVVVTGAARGIGLATARLMGSRGARVAMGDIDGELARSAAREVEGAVALPVDVADRDSFADLLSAVEERLGPVDVLVNNAGVMALGSFLDIDEQVARHQIDVNLLGVIHGMQLALPGMLQRGRGHVLNVSSAAGKFGVPGENVYTATKHAIVGLTEAVRGELAASPLHFSVVLPGPVATELSAGMRAARGIRFVSADAVAVAIARTVERPRPEVWVPRALGWLEASGHLLPRALRDRARRAFGLGLVATRIDEAARSPYEDRAFGHLRSASSPGRRASG
jgi:short-subunit dehydrogenase